METNSIITTIHLCSTEQKELFTALAKAQSQFTVAAYDELNPHFKSKFASYKSLVAATRPALTANGLAVNHKTVTDIDGKQYMITRLMHNSGQYDASLVPLKPDKMNVQGYGSERTYQMRYSYKEIVGVCAHDKEDDDGEAAVAPSREHRSPMANDPIHDKPITQEQLQKLEEAVIGLGNEEYIRARILQYNEVGSFAELPQSDFRTVIKYIIENGKE